MSALEITSQLSPAQAAEVEDLVAGIRTTTGTQPIDETRWAEAVAGRSSFRAILARTEPTGDLIGYAQVTPTGTVWAIDVAAPHGPDEPERLPFALVAAAADVVAGLGGGAVQYWVHNPATVDEAVAEQLGLTPGRELLQFRVPLPLAETTDLVTRPFVPGQDERAWLEVNNAAFAWHPEQGGRTIEDIVARESEPWFDPDGFLLHEIDGRLAGFCWTKLHDPDSDDEPTIGEIYVIAAHPDFHGRGLGRALTVAGLTHLAQQASVGMLYVEADNVAAVGMYDKIGFEQHHVSRAYEGAVAGHDTTAEDRP